MPRGRPREQIEAVEDAPWWSTAEVAAALHKTPKTLRDIALQMGIKDGFAPHVTVKWSFTDVLMLRKELAKRTVRTRDHKKAIAELQAALAAADRGEL